MKHVGSMRARDFGEWLCKMTVYRKANYYFTKSQSKCPGKRDIKNLFSLNAIIIDIDNHTGGNTEWAKEQRAKTEKEILYAIDGILVEDDVILEPNIVVHTGRGIQLIWLLESASKKLSGLYKFVCESYIRAIDSLLSNDERFEGYLVDKACSRRIAGLNRLPGTYNTKTSSLVTFEVIHEHRMDLTKEYDNQLAIAERNGFVIHDGPKKEHKKKNKSRIGTCSSSAASIGKKRVQNLLKLKELRGNTIKKGKRDLFCYVLFNAYRMSGMPPEEALEKVLSINREFVNPLEEHHLVGYLRSSMRKNYKMTNTYIIEILEISKAEQAAINLYPTKRDKKESAYRNAARDRRRKMKIDSRNNNVLRLYLRGLNKTQIAKEVGISRGTVISIIKKAEAQAKLAAESAAKKANEKAAQVCYDIVVDYRHPEMTEITEYTIPEKDSERIHWKFNAEKVEGWECNALSNKAG